MSPNEVPRDIEKSHDTDTGIDPLEREEHVQPYLDPVREKVLTRKMDIFLLPMFCVLYLLSFLDRGNIGNANVADPSISTSLNLTPTQFGATVSVVYATYVVFEPVWANLLKILTPKIMLAGSTLCWGVLTLCTAFAGSYEHLIAIRCLLGAFEAGLFPCIALYVMSAYKRNELGRRMSYIYCCIAGSGAFGGLIAYGLIRVEGGGLVGWQYLYLVEGILSVIAAPVSFFWIPNYLNEAWFLNAEEKESAKLRYEINKANYNPDDRFSWSEVRRGLKDWKTYATGIIQFCGNMPLYGYSTFLPAIIRGMGYSNVNAQLLTVPVYFVAAVSLLIQAHFADKYTIRYPFIMGSFAVQMIGFGMLAGISDLKGRYAGTFIVALGIYGCPGANVPWISNNTAGHYKRSTAVGINQLLGNCAGVAIGFIFTKPRAPRYLLPFYVLIALCAVGMMVTGLTAFTLHKMNLKRAKLIEQGAPDTPETGDDNVHFRYYL